MTKEVLFTKEMMDKEIEEGSIFFLEKYLDQLPLDWIDCITFIMTEGLEPCLSSPPVVILDDESTQKLFKLVAQESLRAFVVSNDHRRIWNVLIHKHVDEEKDDKEIRIIAGGENFRLYCDERNIYYKTGIDSNGGHISITTLQYQKKDGEDCRVPHVFENHG